MSNETTTADIQSHSAWEKLRSEMPILTRGEQAIVYNEMRHNARADVDFYVMIILSATIAFYGLLQNSGAVIIGAMLVAPLMSPMIAIAHSIVMGNIQMFRRAAISTLSGMAGAIAIAALMTLFLPHIKLIPPSDEILGRTHPNILDQYIALASGAAAAYALSRKGVAAALPGVAIAAALVPPLCVVGYGLGSYRWEIASGALLLFLTNLAAIVFAAAVVFMLLGFRPTRSERTEHVRRGVAMAAVGMLIVTVPLLITTVRSIQRLETQLIVNNTLESVIPTDRAEVEDISIEAMEDGYLIGFTAYRYSDTTTSADSEAQRGQLAQTFLNELSESLSEPFAIRARIVDSDLKQVTSAAAGSSEP